MTSLFKPLITSKQPLVVCWGMGQDSTGMIIGMWERGIKPDLIIAADVGCERKGTYSLSGCSMPGLNRWDFHFHQRAQYQPQHYKHWPPYFSLLENRLTSAVAVRAAEWTVLAGGTSHPSTNTSAPSGWLNSGGWTGGLILRRLASMSSPREQRRAHRGCETFAIQDDEQGQVRAATFRSSSGLDGNVSPHEAGRPPTLPEPIRRLLEK